jgi:hypothetical protein
MPVFLKICKLLINSSMRFVKNEFLTPHLTGFANLVGFTTNTIILTQKKAPFE